MIGRGRRPDSLSWPACRSSPRLAFLRPAVVPISTPVWIIQPDPRRPGWEAHASQLVRAEYVLVSLPLWPPPADDASERCPPSGHYHPSDPADDVQSEPGHDGRMVGLRKQKNRQRPAFAIQRCAK